MGLPGDEWKAGTPYEDPADAEARRAAVRVMTAELARFSAAMTRTAAVARALGEAMDELTRPFATHEFMQAGSSPEEAAAEVESCRILAAATGRPFADVLMEAIRGRPHS